MATCDIHPEALAERIEQLKNKIGDLAEANPIYRDDLYLLMWLRCSKFNVDQTEKKIRVAQAWRDDFAKTSSKDGDPETEQHYAFHECRSIDGRVVIVSNTGRMDLIKLFREISVERQERFMLQTLLDLELAVVEANRRNFDGSLGVHAASGLVVLAELGSIPFRAIASPRLAAFYIGLARRLPTYFPGLIQTMFWINAPSAIGLVLGALGKFLGGQFFTAQLVSGPKEVEEKIHSIVSPEALDGVI